jgi:hypothetical protein
MKKSLLTVAAAAMAAVAAHADTTVYEYNFNNFPAGPVKYGHYAESGKFLLQAYLPEKTTNVYDYVKDNWDSDNNGMIITCGNNVVKPYGMTVLNLGSEEGNVLCFNGKGSPLTSTLSNDGISLPETAANGPFYCFNFFLGNEQVSYKGEKVRCEITFAVYQSEGVDSYLNNITLYTNDSGVTLNAKNGSSTISTDVSSATLKSLNAAIKGNNINEFSKWITLAFDVEAGDKGVTGPLYLSFQTNNGGVVNGRTLLVKDLKFSKIDELKYTEGNVTTSAFGAVKAVAATAWTPTITDGVLTYPHAYCNESVEYAMKRVSGATEAELLAAVKAANDSFVDADFAAVAEGDYFTKNSDGNWTVKDDAVVDYVNPVATADDAETLEKVVLAVRVKAGANNVVVGESYYSYGKNSDGNTTTTGVTDVTIAGDDTAEYYNLSGVRVANPTTPGLYIRRQGTKATKVVIK